MIVDGGLTDLETLPTIATLQKALGVTAGLTFNINDTTSFNVEGGYAQNVDADDNVLLPSTMS